MALIIHLDRLQLIYRLDSNGEFWWNRDDICVYRKYSYHILIQPLGSSILWY